MDKKYYTYMLLIEGGALYCGYTDDVEKRFKAHLEGRGAKYTKAHKPLRVVYTKEFDNYSNGIYSFAVGLMVFGMEKNF